MSKYNNTFMNKNTIPIYFSCKVIIFWVLYDLIRKEGLVGILGIDIEGMMEFEFIDYLYICDTHKNSKLYRLKSHPCNKLNTPTSHFLSIIKTKVYKIFFSPIQIRENVFCVYLRRQGLMFADVAVFFYTRALLI